MNIDQRWKRHRKDLRLNKHHSSKLQKHFNKYGKQDLQFSLLFECDKEVLINAEQAFLDYYTPFFNTCRIAGSVLGLKWYYIKKLSTRKPILQYDLQGNFIKEWESSRDIKRELNIDDSTIRHCCRGDKKYKSSKSFIWIYKKSKSINNKIEVYCNNIGKYNAKSVNQYDLQNKFIKKWDSALQAAKSLGFNPSHIRECCKGKNKYSKGFIWKYKK